MDSDGYRPTSCEKIMQKGLSYSFKLKDLEKYS